MKNTAKTNNSFDDRTNPPRSRIREISPKKVVGEAQRIVKLAADILEEEIAAGIIAAKEIEKKVINVEEVRSQDVDHIVTRFRSDAHEVVDILLDVVSVASKQLENISNRVVNISTVNKNKSEKQPTNVPVIRNEKAVAPGEETAIAMLLQNDSRENLMKVELNETDLVSPSGKRILTRNIRMRPKVLKLNPGDKKEVKVIVKVPKNTKPGQYSGLLQDKQIPNLQAMLTLDVSE